MDYYKILEIPEGADQKAIKRAYFKLVRQYTPEKDPERFQQIREAYENLMADDGAGNDKFRLEFPAGPLADQMRQEITRRMNARDYQGIMDISQEGLWRYGESEGFLYFLALSQRLAGKTGKSVKNFERLTVLFPDRAVHRRELAISYMERGYGKKAYAAFGKAYHMGCRDHDFLSLYALCCRDRGEGVKSIELLMEMVAQMEKKPKDHAFELLDAYGGLGVMGRSLKEGQRQDVLERFLKFLQEASPYLKEYQEELMRVLSCMVQNCFQPSLFSLFGEAVKTAEGIFFSGKRGNRGTYGEMWDALKEEVEQKAVEEDGRISELLKEGYEAFVIGDEDPSVMRFMQREAELCMVEEWPAIREEIQIVQKEYPIYWEKIQDFVHTLEHAEDLERVRAQLQKDYDRREKYMTGGLYYERYPNRRAAQPVTRWNSEEDGTFTRSQKKIGRNEPCPCGSGKKYKNCCGKK